VYSLHLSKEGETLLEQTRQLHDEHISFVASLLGRPDLKRLIELLAKLGDYRP
jgi:hypothetical protein